MSASYRLVSICESVAFDHSLPRLEIVKRGQTRVQMGNCLQPAGTFVIYDVTGLFLILSQLYHQHTSSPVRLLSTLLRRLSL